MANLKVVGICGSLRKDSINGWLLKEAGNLLNKEIEFQVADISKLPLYNSDSEEVLPVAVEELGRIVQEADAIIISSPEYNSSITGVLKNALDWLSRPVINTPLANKPVAVIGATPGILGTIRSQLHLREILFALNMKLIRRPEVLIGQAGTKFNEFGELTDERGLMILKELVNNLETEISEKSLTL